jgi:hypothetical protein
MTVDISYTEPVDTDGDGYYPPQDCDDTKADVYPKAPGETPGDRIDTNCNGSDDCFIATASFGTMMEGKIAVLREFREEYLMKRASGKALVGAYYKYSPPIADYIAQRPWLRPVVRILLLPVIGLVSLFV